MNSKLPIKKSISPLANAYGHYPARILIVLGFIILSAQMLSAQSIGNWTFNNTLAGTAGIYNTVSTADFSTSVPSRSFNGSTEYYGENGWPAGSINTSMYLQFSLTPLSGYQLDISTIVLRMRRSNTGSPAGSGPTAWTLRSSLNGYATDIATGSITDSYANYTVTPGSSFINMYTAVTFRLYGYNATVSSGGNSRFVFDNITVNGIGYLLPARLGAFNGSAAAEKVNLSYTLFQTEKGNLYSIERSLDGISFNTVNATTETENVAEKKYNYTDDINQVNNTDRLFYRLRLRDNSGAVSYSAIVIVSVKNKQIPVKTFISNKQLHINGIFAAAGIYQVNVYNTAGQQLNRISFTATPGYNSFVFYLNRQMPASVIVHITNGKEYSDAVTILNQ